MGFQNSRYWGSWERGGSANTPPRQPQDLPRNLGEQTVYLQSTCEDTAAPKQWRVRDIKSLVQGHGECKRHYFFKERVNLLTFVAMSEKEGPLQTESEVSPRQTAAVNGFLGASLVGTLRGYNRTKPNPEERWVQACQR